MTETPKILYFDIETTDLKANIGTLLMMGYRWEGEKKSNILSIREYKGWNKSYASMMSAEKKLVRDCIKVIEEADVIVGHYSKRFDIKFLNTRSIMQNGRPIAPVAHVDTFDVAKRSLLITSKRLGAIAEVLNVPGKISTTYEMWKKSRLLIPSVFPEMEKYCKQDVDCLFDVFQKLRSTAVEMPHLSLLSDADPNACPSCGSHNLQKRGHRLTGTAKYQRHKCKDCNTWSQTRATVVSRRDAVSKARR